MRISSAAIVIALFMLIGERPVAGQPTFGLRSGSPLQLAADDDTAADRNTYLRKVQEDMQEWQRKLHQFGEAAKAKGQEAGGSAEKGLDDAWVKAKDESRKLQTVGAEGWQGAKTSYEKATDALAAEWRKLHPGDH
ncbi:MAG TPA: hypothetical protein VE397_13510 [Stellaceae bacterium]|nr:hypothetical protein [Stellaceae bacterium]